MQFIIARYAENIDWSLDLSNVLIYNKGGPITINAPVLTLPNLGREGHTFAWHIVHNYDTLAEYTCFLQGHPFDHCPNLFDILEPAPFKFLTKWIIQCNLSGCRYHSNLPLRSCFQSLFHSDMTDNFNFGAGAQMIVSRERIHRHPKSFYERIVTMLETSINPIEGFVIERFWGLIFDMDKPEQLHAKIAYSPFFLHKSLP